MTNSKINVIKIPLKDYEKPRNYSQDFKRMATLYLEIIENKDKIKQDLINKPYVSFKYKNISEDSYHTNKNNISEFYVNENNKDDQYIKNNVRDRHEQDGYNRDRDARDNEDRDGYSRDRDDMDDYSRDRENKDDYSRDRENKDDYSRDRENKDDYSRDRENRDRGDRDDRDDRDRDDRDRDRDDRDDRDGYSRDRDDRDGYSRDRNSTNSDNLSIRLKELLSDNESENYKSSHHKTPHNKYSDPNRSRRYHKTPPTLAELEAEGKYQYTNELRNINNIPKSDYEIEDNKREIMFKFDLLKKSYPNADIPEFTLHSDYNTMQKTYESTIHRLSLDSTVESYKTYLIGGFMLVEFILGNFLKFDMQGFTQQQILSMNSYDRLLIELGEKSYVPSGSKWPVELRLFFLIVINAVFFIVSKMIMNKTGANLLNMVNNMNVSKNPSNVNHKKRRMKGPNIDINDIPDVEN